MTKEEYMAISLPYELLIMVENAVTPNMAIGINQMAAITIHSTKNIGYFNPTKTGIILSGMCITQHCKPILHPLSDLTKEITHKGKTFVPNDGMSISRIRRVADTYIELVNGEIWSIERLRFDDVQKLIKWHFPVGISENDYIDVNTLDKNPYE